MHALHLLRCRHVGAKDGEASIGRRGLTTQGSAEESVLCRDAAIDTMKEGKHDMMRHVLGDVLVVQLGELVGGHGTNGRG